MDDAGVLCSERMMWVFLVRNGWCGCLLLVMDGLQVLCVRNG